MTTITLVTYDQHLVAAEQPIIASGAKNAAQVRLKTDPTWDGFTIYVSFYRDGDRENVLDVPLDEEGFARVPTEMILEPCALCIGIWGKDGDGRYKASTMVPYRIRLGTPIEEGIIPLDVSNATATEDAVLEGATFYAGTEVLKTGSIETYAEGDLVETAPDDQEEEYSLPVYWQTAVNTAVAKVKALQDSLGADAVNFVWFSDMHHNTANKYTQNIGALCAAVMDACHIPLTLMCGDTMSADAVSEESVLLSWLEDAAEVLSPIGSDRLIQIRGNHDDVYGSHTASDGTTKYYVNKVAPQKIWNRIFRRQATDFRRVFGGDGSYFYLDNPTQKVRMICLNSHFYDGEQVTNGTTGAMSSGFGADQLDWLENIALQTEEGWHVILTLHVPPTASAINGNTYYLSQLSDGTDLRLILQNTEASLLGIFCGHCHVDAAVTNDLPCPIVTITCAINTPYDGTGSTRVAGTDTETAIDIVTIDRKTGTIYTTRLGAGEDRCIVYTAATDDNPFALTASNWACNSSVDMTIGTDGITLIRGAGNGVYITCLHQFTRKEGTYSFSVKGNGVIHNGGVNTIVQIFDAAGNEITETGHYVPNHSYTYSTAYEGFAMNTLYGEFTFTLTDDVAYFRMKFAPGSAAAPAEGDAVLISDFNLVEPTT